MHSQLIRVVADEEPNGWGDWAANKAHNGLKLGLRRFAPSSDQIKTAGNMVASAAAGVGSLFHKSAAGQIREIYASKAMSLLDIDGDHLAQNVVYGEHPLFEDRLIRADVLHACILREQRAQIIRYFRASVALKSLIIEIVSQKSGRFYASGGWKTYSFGGGRESSEEQRRWFTVTYDDPKKDASISTENLFWMPHFSEIVEATKDASGGTIETVTSINTSFGITAEAAKLSNIDTNWISQQSFTVRAEYV